VHAASQIGVFDSGVGGLSIRRALREKLPEASMVYVGDVSHAPYGDRFSDEVIARSMRIAEWLVAQSAIMTAVACNTATVLAIGALRARRPELVFVGVEPGVKPAAVQSRTRRIAVLATVATANSERLRGSDRALRERRAHPLPALPRPRSRNMAFHRSTRRQRCACSAPVRLPRCNGF